MAKASALRLGQPQNMLFKGPFGFGKTLAAASFALEGPVYLSYWDKKSPIELLTYFTKERFGDKADKILDNITYDVYASANAGEYLNKLLDMVQDCRYVAIINDSLTYMTSAAVNWSLNFGKENKLNKKMKDILPSWDEYKVETSLISQCMDVSRLLPAHVIWTAHPLPTTKVDGSGSSIRVSKINSLVSYGSKVAGMVPGGFTEIYHFAQQSNWSSDGKGSKRYVCELNAVGDEFAKSPLLADVGIKELDFTDRLFYEVWKEALDKATAHRAAAGNTNTASTTEGTTNPNPFATNPGSKWKT